MPDGRCRRRTAESVLFDVLAARPARAVGVHLDVGGVHLDVDLVVDHRRDEHRRERRVPPVAGIERRLAHQPVHAGLGAQPAVRVVAVDLDRGALDAGDFARTLVDHGRREAARVGPAQVHAQQHLRPSPGPRCRLRPPGCRGTRRAGPSRRETCATARACARACRGPPRPCTISRESRLVALGLDEVEQLRGVRKPGRSWSSSVVMASSRARSRPRDWAFVRRVPDRRIAELVVQLLEALALRVILKGTPSAPSGAP